jgi:hypothetical protein
MYQYWKRLLWLEIFLRHLNLYVGRLATKPLHLPIFPKSILPNFRSCSSFLLHDIFLTYCFHLNPSLPVGRLPFIFIFKRYLFIFHSSLKRAYHFTLLIYLFMYLQMYSFLNRISVFVSFYTGNVIVKKHSRDKKTAHTDINAHFQLWFWLWSTQLQ